jgi:hypothetical protein
LLVRVDSTENNFKFCRSNFDFCEEAQGAGGEEDVAEDAHQLLTLTLAQGGELPDNRVYLDSCSTVNTAFKNQKYLKNIKTED